jgi:hypothetical protein
MPSRFKIASEHLLADWIEDSQPSQHSWRLAFEDIHHDDSPSLERRKQGSGLAPSWLAMNDIGLWDSFWCKGPTAEPGFALWAGESLCAYAMTPQQGDAPQAYAALASLISTNPSPKFAGAFALSLWHLAAYGCNSPPATSPIDGALAKAGLAKTRAAWKDPQWTRRFFESLPECLMQAGSALGSILEEMALESETDKGRATEPAHRL